MKKNYFKIGIKHSGSFQHVQKISPVILSIVVTLLVHGCTHSRQLTLQDTGKIHSAKMFCVMEQKEFHAITDNSTDAVRAMAFSHGAIGAAIGYLMTSAMKPLTQNEIRDKLFLPLKASLADMDINSNFAHQLRAELGNKIDGFNVTDIATRQENLKKEELYKLLWFMPESALVIFDIQHTFSVNLRMFEFNVEVSVKLQNHGDLEAPSIYLGEYHFVSAPRPEEQDTFNYWLEDNGKTTRYAIKEAINETIKMLKLDFLDKLNKPHENKNEFNETVYVDLGTKVFMFIKRLQDNDTRVIIQNKQGALYSVAKESLSRPPQGVIDAYTEGL